MWNAGSPLSLYWACALFQHVGMLRYKISRFLGPKCSQLWHRELHVAVVLHPSAHRPGFWPYNCQKVHCISLCYGISQPACIRWSVSGQVKELGARAKSVSDLWVSVCQKWICVSDFLSRHSGQEHFPRLGLKTYSPTQGNEWHWV